MNILNFLAANWDSVLVVIVFVALLVFLSMKGEKKIVYKILYTLVTEAEKRYGGGTGSLKQAAVIEQIYNQLPAVVKLIITVQTLEKWVDEAVELAKKEWSKNANLQQYIAEPPIDETKTK